METTLVADPADDDRIRTGTVWTATTHAITAVIGSGVLALPWSVAQMGWILGPIVLIACAFVTYYTAVLLCDCYRTPDPVYGKRNHTYMDVVRSNLGPKDVFICGVAQNTVLWGVMIGYTIAVSMSMMAVERTNCVHYKGHGASCGESGDLYMIIFGILEIVLSQFPSLDKITLISVIATVMSFTYSFIGLALCAVKFASHHFIGGSIWGVKTGVDGVSASTKTWQSLQALGNIAFAYSFSMILIEVQDTLKSPPAENKTMKRATLYAIVVTTMFYISLACVGYAAFGNAAPGNVLTGFDEPFWLVDIANIAVVIHLIGAYQIFAQTLYAKYEEWLGKKWADSSFFHKVYTLPLPFSNSFDFTLCRLILRTALVVFTTLICMLLPFFNAIVGLLGSIAFWPLAVYYPVTVYIKQTNIKGRERKWVFLQTVSMVALLVSVAAAVGSVADIAQKLKHVEVFKI